MECSGDIHPTSVLIGSPRTRTDFKSLESKIHEWKGSKVRAESKTVNIRYDNKGVFHLSANIATNPQFCLPLKNVIQLNLTNFY